MVGISPITVTAEMPTNISQELCLPNQCEAQEIDIAVWFRQDSFRSKVLHNLFVIHSSGYMCLQGQ